MLTGKKFVFIHERNSFFLSPEVLSCGAMKMTPSLPQTGGSQRGAPFDHPPSGYFLHPSKGAIEFWAGFWRWGRKSMMCRLPGETREKNLGSRALQECATPMSQKDLQDRRFLLRGGLNDSCLRQIVCHRFPEQNCPDHASDPQPG